MDLVKTTNKELLVNYNLNSNLNITSVNKALTSDTPTINRLIKAKGNEFSEGLIEALLAQLSQKLKFKEKLTDQENERLAKSIISKYSNLKIADFIYVFNQIADGEIELYGSLSHRDVMRALYKHNENRWKHKNY